MGPPGGVEGTRSRRDAGFRVVLAAGLAVGLADLAKPVHVDDTLYLTIARRIAGHPLDPYGGTLNWQQVPEPTYAVSISPPLLSYVFALVIAVAGESPLALHAAMIPWPLLASWAIYRLGRRRADAATATALTLSVILGPAVLAGMNLMLDVPLLACVCAATECLLRGVERRSAGWTASASLIGAAGVLIKFPALALVPIFGLASILFRRKGPALAAAGPLLALVAWQAASRSLYGSTQVQTGLAFLGQFRTLFGRQVVERSLTMFAILAWTFPVWVLAPSQSRNRGRIGAAVAALLATSAAALLLGDALGRRPGLGAAFLAGAALGSFGVVTALLPGERREPGETGDGGLPRPLLWAWIFGVAAIVIPFGPFVAVRSFLPIQPPLALLLLSRRRPSRIPLWATVGLSAALGTTLAAVDFRWASCYPTAVQGLSAGYGGTTRPIVFCGHWGWQYYAERAGFTPWDARWKEAPAGSIVVIPLRADRQWIHPDALRGLRRLERIEIPAPRFLPITTWNRAAGLRFYGGDYGELPWGLSPEPTEEFFVLATATASVPTRPASPPVRSPF